MRVITNGWPTARHPEPTACLFVCVTICSVNYLFMTAVCLLYLYFYIYNKFVLYFIYCVVWCLDNQQCVCLWSCSSASPCPASHHRDTSLIYRSSFPPIHCKEPVLCYLPPPASPVCKLPCGVRGLLISPGPDVGLLCSTK